MKALDINGRMAKNGMLLVLTHVDFLLLHESEWTADQAKNSPDFNHMHRDESQDKRKEEIFENNWTFLTDLMEQFPGLRVRY